MPMYFPILIMGSNYTSQRWNQLPGLFYQFHKLNSEVMMRSSTQEANLYIPRSKNRIGDSLKLIGARL